MLDTSAAQIDADGPRVLLVGASGFIGSAVSRGLTARGWVVTHLVHEDLGQPGRHLSVRGDLSDLSSLHRACSGQQIVVNAASYVGSDVGKQQAINGTGAANLARAVELAGVTRLLYVSSTSVYGRQVANGSPERSSGFVPRSTLSSSRLDAERATISVGGVVLRPHLVYGRGDRFFLGPLLKAMDALGGWIEDGRARVSAISNDALGRLIAEAVIGLPSSADGSQFHAAHPETVTVRQLVERVLLAAGRQIPERSYAAGHVLESLGGSGVGASQIAMVAADNWVDSRSVWETLGISPGPKIDMSVTSDEWYRSVLPPLRG